MSREHSSTAEVWYRAEARVYHHWDENLERHVGPGYAQIWYQKYRVLRHTPKGVWVHNGGALNSESFVLENPAGKRLCYKRKEDALYSLIARKRRALGILENRQHEAELVIKEAECTLQTSSI